MFTNLYFPPFFTGSLLVIHIEIAMPFRAVVAYNKKPTVINNK
jgi:F0F1-type ATP synthase assembly protein I